MRLFETIYMKIIGKHKVYYLIYRSYVAKSDGYIYVGEINKKRFEAAKETGLKVEETNLEAARFGIKRRIERNYFKGVKNEVS